MTTPYRVVLADPAWKFNDKLPGDGRGAEKHYTCLSIEEMCKLELPPLADDALIFMWRVAAMQEEALTLMHMWGFDQKSEIVWIKTKNGVVIADDTEVVEDDCAFGMGRYTRACHEVCLIGARGKGASLIKKKNVRSVFFAERQEHSRKPDKFYEIVESLVDGEGPFVELFARRARAGWKAYGDELGSKLTSSDRLESN